MSKKETMQTPQILKFEDKQIRTTTYNGQLIFLASDIIIKCLGYSFNTKLSGYKENRNNQQYVIEVPSNRPSEDRIYLTAEGIKVILLTSRKHKKSSCLQRTIQEYLGLVGRLLNLVDYGGNAIPIYGTLDNPLFKVQDILIQLLGYRDCDKAKFFEEMKTDSYYVIEDPDKRVDCLFFTELGLYKCLFMSNQKVAKQFTIQVCQMLKNMRLGNLEIKVNKECEFTDMMLSAEANPQLSAIVNQNDHLRKQVLELKLSETRLKDSLQVKLNNYETVKKIKKGAFFNAQNFEICSFQSLNGFEKFLRCRLVSGKISSEEQDKELEKVRNMNREEFQEYMKSYIAKDLDECHNYNTKQFMEQEELESKLNPRVYSDLSGISDSDDELLQNPFTKSQELAIAENDRKWKQGK